VRRNKKYLRFGRQRVQSSRKERERVRTRKQMRNETGERREWGYLKATAVKWREGRRNQRVLRGTEGSPRKRGVVVQLIAGREKILGIATVAAKRKGPSDLRGKKEKAQQRGPKTNSKKVPNNMTKYLKKPM
jgi:hypothetical protein